MNTMSISPVVSQSPGLALADNCPQAKAMFLASVVIVATIVFTVPFTEAWARSTQVNFDNTVDGVDASAREGTLARQVALGSLGLFGLVALVWPGGKTLRIQNVLGVVCICYLMWCLATCFWSDDISRSLRRWIALMCEVAAGVAIAKRTSVRQFVWIVFACTLSWLVLGIVSELAHGTFRPFEVGHRFAGIFHPNIMGVNVAILTLSTLYLATGANRRNWLLVCFALVCVIFLLLTRSRTSLAAMLGSVATYWIVMAPAPRKYFYTLLGGMAIAGVTLAVGLGIFSISADWASMGRQVDDPESLTGRLPLWQELLDKYLPQSPLVGHGYGAFWSADRIAGMSRTQAWEPSHAHSSYLDLALNVGLVGAALCVAAMALAALTALRREALHAGSGYGFIAMIVAFVTIAGITETYIGMTWFLSFFGVCGVCYLLFDNEHEPVIRSRPVESLRPSPALRRIATT